MCVQITFEMPKPKFKKGDIVTVTPTEANTVWFWNDFAGEKLTVVLVRGHASLTDITPDGKAKGGNYINSINCAWIYVLKTEGNLIRVYDESESYLIAFEEK